ncbi:GNAT family N-acetyltransferase [Facklamia miroungae]|uniref:Protein N-acetyltransferase, RimJ/RimL family n=1 Tax=Facklamia miroungae TaxID=120956 RepID=A0A1G7QBG0_9LACT|nr:GNAT family protein [Facklamia miroungae]NKZ28886.1 GNAT family N-acetyltransferase [Facklamia miroungae]SDF95765.1 Protein N-acetyltransferase, RimJ/RimL family [Facklamia miroungae]
MEITYKNILIRNAEKADAAKLCQWWNDGKIMAILGFPNGLGKSVAEIEDKIENYTDEKGRLLLIEYQGKSIGEMFYDNLGNQVAEIHIKICEAIYRNKGLGRIFLSLLTKELFNQGYQKIILDVNPQNTRAQHVYELLGFKKLRINYNSWVDQLGCRQSSVDYELVENDFRDYAV